MSGNWVLPVLADRARSECARSMRAVGIIPATLEGNCKGVLALTFGYFADKSVVHETFIHFNRADHVAGCG